MIHDEDKEYVKETVRAIIYGEEKKNIKFRMVISENTVKCISATAFMDLENNVLIGVAEDITKDTQYIFNLEKYASEKNSTLEILSHDLASPMNTIQQLTAC